MEVGLAGGPFYLFTSESPGAKDGDGRGKSDADEVLHGVRWSDMEVGGKAGFRFLD